jgi:non-ribosomal peptide synthetase component F
LNLITDSDKQQIFKWNAAPPTIVERCIHNLIEDQVESHPEKEAVCAWDGSFTYVELDRLAAKLALHLIELGVRPENRVVLCMDKSV